MATRRTTIKRVLRDIRAGSGTEWDGALIAQFLWALNGGNMFLPERTPLGVIRPHYGPVSAAVRSEVTEALQRARVAAKPLQRTDWQAALAPPANLQFYALNALVTAASENGTVDELLGKIDEWTKESQRLRAAVVQSAADEAFIEVGWTVVSGLGPALDCVTLCKNPDCGRWFVAIDDRTNYCRPRCRSDRQPANVRVRVQRHRAKK